MNARRNTTKKISLAELEALRRERDLAVAETAAREEIKSPSFRKSLAVGAARLLRETFTIVDSDDVPPTTKRKPSDSGFGGVPRTA